MLQWVRGGTWATSGTHAWIPSLRPAEPAGDGVLSMKEALDRARLELASRRFLEDPSLWEELIGAPGGLIRYQLQPRDRDQVLQAAREAARRVPQPTAARGSDGCTQEEQEVLADFLRRFGPLGPIVGVLEPCPPMTHEREVRALSLTYLRDQLHLLARASELMTRIRSNPREQEAVWQTALPYLHEVSVWPHARTMGIKYRLQPASLRAYVWMEICRSTSVVVGPRCKVCRRALPRRSGRGRQREYCSEHSSEKFRDQVNRESLLEPDEWE